MDIDINKSFKQECKVINLELEYEGYVGNERYAIITDLSEEELNARYSTEIERYKPFIILTRAMGLVMKKHEHDEKKHAMREARGEIHINCNADDETMILALTEDDDQLVREAIKEAFIESLRINDISSKALKTLTPLQQKYLIQHYAFKKGYREIAREEGKHVDTVWSICMSGLERYIKAVNSLEVA